MLDKLPALQSVADKNTYLVEKMSAPDLAQLKGGEMFFTLNFSPFILFNIHEVFLFMMFLTVLTSRCQKFPDHLMVIYIYVKCISYLIIEHLHSQSVF